MSDLLGSGAVEGAANRPVFPKIEIIPGQGGTTVVLPADRVKYACVARGWSWSRLAREAGISRPTMAAVAAGSPVRPSTAWRVASALARGHVASLLGDWLSHA